MKEKFLQIQSQGGHSFRFYWGWKCGKEKEGGLGILFDDLNGNFNSGGMVISREDCDRLVKFITKRGGKDGEE
jgi:hypothetical protein